VNPGARSGNSCRSLQPSALAECGKRAEFILGKTVPLFVVGLGIARWLGER
jgi:hypothetical protein